MTRRTLVRIAMAISCLTLTAADWPQWRGPMRNGISPEEGLLQEWPKDGPKQVWQVTDAGSGYSTPAVVGNQIYLLGNEGVEKEFVQARRAKDGSVLWTTRIGNVGKPDQRPPYPGARSTPTVDGELLYALGSDGDLACLETATGKIRWQKNVTQEYGGKSGKWAYSESPLVDGDLVICTPGGEKATVIALKKSTGELVWESAVPGGDEAGYASVVISQAGGVKQYVQLLAKGVVGLDAKTGEFLWRYAKPTEGSQASIPTPIAEKSLVYAATGQGGGGLVKLASADGKFSAEESYFSAKLPTAIGGAVKVGDYLYGTNRSGLMCVEFATGEVKWQDRCVGAASVCYADGRLYVHGENGDVALVATSPDAYQEKGRFTPANQPDRGRSQAWAYPVVANGRLYLRDMNVLTCYDIEEK